MIRDRPARAGARRSTLTRKLSDAEKVDLQDVNVTGSGYGSLTTFNGPLSRPEGRIPGARAARSNPSASLLLFQGHESVVKSCSVAALAQIPTPTSASAPPQRQPDAGNGPWPAGEAADSTKGFTPHGRLAKIQRATLQRRREAGRLALLRFSAARTRLRIGCSAWDPRRCPLRGGVVVLPGLRRQGMPRKASSTPSSRARAGRRAGKPRRPMHPGETREPRARRGSLRGIREGWRMRT